MPKFLRDFLFGGAGAASPLGDLGLLLGRVSIGLMMLVGHGMAKLWGSHGFGPPQMMVDGVKEMGLPAPLLMAWLATLAETMCAGLVALGLLTRPAALALVINMSVAAFVAHAQDPLFFTGGRAKEMALLYLFPFLMFLLAGAGRFSIDRLIHRADTRRGFPVTAK